MQENESKTTESLENPSVSENRQANQQVENPDYPEKMSIGRFGLKSLDNTARWGRFFAILGFISMGIMILVGIGIVLMEPFLKGLPAFTGLIYIALAVLYLFPSLYLLHFANQIKKGLLNSDVTILERGLYNLQRTYQFVGNTTIALIGLYMLVVIFIGVDTVIFGL
ncbi:MAG: hypothetical protein ACLFM1_07740 [Bacteroidales bacterium]